jgi:hypothetical protein
LNARDAAETRTRTEATATRAATAETTSPYRRRNNHLEKGRGIPLPQNLTTMKEELDAIKLVTVSQTIHIGPCRLQSVTLSGDAANADCDIHDGDNASAEKKLHLEAPSGETALFAPSRGVKMNYGIHVVVNAATSNCTVTYHPLSKNNPGDSGLGVGGGGRFGRPRTDVERSLMHGVSVEKLPLRGSGQQM